MTEYDKKNDTPQEARRVALPFCRTNFLMMGGCVLFIIICFALMSCGGSPTDTDFNPDIFSTRRIVVGPAIAFIGFVAMALAIIIKPTCKNKANGHA